MLSVLCRLNSLERANCVAVSLEFLAQSCDGGAARAISCYEIQSQFMAETLTVKGKGFSIPLLVYIGRESGFLLY